jgi:hypothetical protein
MSQLPDYPEADFTDAEPHDIARHLLGKCQSRLKIARYLRHLITASIFENAKRDISTYGI